MFTGKGCSAALGELGCRCAACGLPDSVASRKADSLESGPGIPASYIRSTRSGTYWMLLFGYANGAASETCSRPVNSQQQSAAMVAVRLIMSK